MTTRLAAVLLLAASTSACVSQSDGLGLDGLPSYDADTGAGKGDDPNCTDESYRTFIQGFMAGTAAADANPCAWGNDASYRIWAYVAGEQLKPMLEAYRDAKHKRFAERGPKAAVIAAGTLDAATVNTLTKLEAIRPAHAGKVGAAAWIEYLYGPVYAAAVNMVAGNQAVILTEGIDQQKLEITEFEEVWFSFAERNQPTATEGHAYTVWWETVKNSVNEATGSLRPTSEPALSITSAFLERLAATHPAGNFDEDATTFHTDVTAAIAADYGALGDPTKFTAKIALVPSGGGPTSYKVWATAFASVAQSYTATANEKQKALFQQIIDVRPCASGPDVEPLVERLTTGLAAAGNGPDGTPIAQLSVPVACAL